MYIHLLASDLSVYLRRDSVWCPHEHHEHHDTINFRIELEQEDIQKVKEKTYPANRGRSKFGLKGIRIVYAKAKNDQSQDTLTTLKAQHLVVAHEEMLNDKRREIAQRGLDNLARALTITEEEFDQRYQLT